MPLAAAGENWTGEEIAAIIDDYFAMRSMELRGEPYVKSQHNANMQRLIGRSKGSIEFKHQNISAVLMALGEPRIKGYKPAWNFQKALLDGIESHLFNNAQPTEDLTKQRNELALDGVLYTEPAPEVKLQAELNKPDLVRLVRKFNPAARDAVNRALGKRGEERVYRSEIGRLRALAARIWHVGFAG